MRKMKVISLCLAIISIFSILISCGENTPNDTDSTVSGVSDNQSANNPSEENIVQESSESDLPDIGFGGYTFTFLAHLYEGNDWSNPTPIEIISEAENSEPINDAVYKRNLKIKEKYDIDIKMIPASDEKDVLNKAVKAGESAYDAVVMFNNNIPGIITSDLLVDTTQLPYIDLDKPWWDPAVKSMSIVNKNYLLGGDLLILDNEATNALLFNKELMADLGIELPYNLVKEGKWTMDKMNDIIKDVGMDLNGDGMMTAFEDRWGFCVFNDTLHALLVSGNGSLGAKDKDDIPYMDFASSKNLAVLDKAMDLLYNPQYVLNAKSPPKGGAKANSGLEIYKPGFEENRILFLWIRMRVVELFRGMEANFGIVPLPKLDETQDKYYSVVNPYTGALLGIPKSADNLERVSIILEALAAESRYTLQPAYYDVVLQRKYARDNESSEMLDIIFNSRIYDIGSVYSFGDIYMDFITLASKQDRNIASLYEKKSGQMQSAIDRIVSTFWSME